MMHLAGGDCLPEDGLIHINGLSLSNFRPLSLIHCLGHFYIATILCHAFVKKEKNPSPLYERCSANRQDAKKETMKPAKQIKTRARAHAL
jgi:hypothetical protein